MLDSRNLLPTKGISASRCVTGVFDFDICQACGRDNGIIQPLGRSAAQESSVVPPGNVKVHGAIGNDHARLNIEQ